MLPVMTMLYLEGELNEEADEAARHIHFYCKSTDTNVNVEFNWMGHCKDHIVLVFDDIDISCAKAEEWGVSFLSFIVPSPSQCVRPNGWLDMFRTVTVPPRAEVRRLTIDAVIAYVQRNYGAHTTIYLWGKSAAMFQIAGTAIARGAISGIILGDQFSCTLHKEGERLKVIEDRKVMASFSMNRVLRQNWPKMLLWGSPRGDNKEIQETMRKSGLKIDVGGPPTRWWFV